MAGVDSAIVRKIPALFAEFGGKRFKLLWRGTRDGFGAWDFHRRCDWHANTLTLIEDTDGNIFGGFTPVEWESRDLDYLRDRGENQVKADPSLRSFLFTLKERGFDVPRKFALKAEWKDRAIRCSSVCGPHFGDIGVSDNCNANTRSFTSGFGCRYANDTYRAGYTVFTGLDGGSGFRVKEIEVFEITD